MPSSHHVGDRFFFSSQTLSAEKHREGNWFLKRLEQTTFENISHGEPTARSDRLASCGGLCSSRVLFNFIVEKNSTSRLYRVMLSSSNTLSPSASICLLGTSLALLMIFSLPLKLVPKRLDIESLFFTPRSHPSPFHLFPWPIVARYWERSFSVSCAI